MREAIGGHRRSSEVFRPPWSASKSYQIREALRDTQMVKQRRPEPVRASQSPQRPSAALSGPLRPSADPEFLSLEAT